MKIGIQMKKEVIIFKSQKEFAEFCNKNKGKTIKDIMENSKCC